MSIALWLKALGAWFVILFLAVANGALREGLLIPALGRMPGLAMSGVLLCGLVMWVAYGLARLSHGFSRAQGLLIGCAWLGCTLCFEFGFGRWVQHKPWHELLEAYAFKDGNLWPLVLVVVLLSPTLAARFSRRR